MSDEKPTRREFIKKSTYGAVGAGLALNLTAAGLANAAGANDRLHVAVMGVHNRGASLAEVFARHDEAQVDYICDVDSQVVDEAVNEIGEIQNRKPKGIEDFRTVLDQTELDALVIAAPDHWHTPAGILALEAGKHVYVEKPCSHNAREGELLVKAQQKYDRVVQMGNQQRSDRNTIQLMKKIHQGAIGRPYAGKAFYANDRGPIGYGKPASVPDHLNYELWQGPAPRTPYQDNLIHYNWHWFWNWGTGEINNNGTHEIDLCRWALQVDYPTEVQSSGGRFHFDDDWEFYDTQIATFKFPGDKMISWEGRSCNPFRTDDRGRGAEIYGTEGSVILDRNGYQILNLDNEVVEEVTEETQGDQTDITSAGSSMNAWHIDNFIKAIQQKEEQHSPIDEGHKSVLLNHLGNIALLTGRVLKTDPGNGHIRNLDNAMEHWGREYESGWEPKV